MANELTRIVMARLSQGAAPERRSGGARLSPGEDALLSALLHPEAVEGGPARAAPRPEPGKRAISLAELAGRQK